MPKPLTISIGVFAHNEEQNVAKTLQSILKQQTETARIKEIVVVSSGSDDRTNQIVRQWMKKDRRIQLIEQFKRQGKSSAVNVFLRKAKSRVVVVCSADLRLHAQAIEEIVTPLLQKRIGMVGAHPIPTNTHSSQVGAEVRMMWQLHHLISLIEPKCGEMVAFRNVIRSIPKQAAMDEATIEVLLKMIGYRVIYAPQAIVYNRGPLTVRDFIVQRRRNYTGHLYIQQRYQYQVATNKPSYLFSTMVQLIKSHPKQLFPLIRLVLLEQYCRILGWLDFFILGKNPYKWRMIAR